MAWVRRGAAFTAGATLTLALAWLAWKAGGVLILVFAAVLLAAGLEPVVGLLRSRLPVGRGASILLTYGAFFISVVAIAFIAVPAALNQLAHLSAELPKMLADMRAWALELRPPGLGRAIATLVAAAQKAVGPAPPPDADTVLEIGFTVAEAVVSLVTLLTLTFFWLTEHARLQRYALAFVSADRRPGAREIWNDVEARLGLWVRGQLIIMGSVAVGTGVLYTLLGLPSALLLGLVAGLAEAIPLVGPILGAIPALLVAATVDPQHVAIVALAYLAIQIVEGNVLVPIVMRNTVGLSPMLVISSLLIGAAAGGILGAILAVPTAAAIEVILERLQQRE
ncbi:MAG: AI-2E family transporter, partial [Candidatus Limnocylindrales bacterium]